MKKILFLSVFLIFACSTDSEGNPCVYEPTLTTEAATDITETSATLNGVISILSENCDVPNNTEQGFVYSTEIQPTLEDIQVNVNGTNISSTIEGLTPNTTYYVRAFLTNNLGEFYGNEVSFSTEEEPTGSCDGAPYPSIVYGTQEWTVENACHTTYRDGTPIPQVTNNNEWGSLSTGAWCYYDNDPTKGKLYNWYAVAGIHDNDENTPNKEFAPEGWHVPSDAEWTTLEEYFIANGLNISGFIDLPVGVRNAGGSFEENYAVFWSSSDGSPNGAYNRWLYNGSLYYSDNFDNKQSGNSVRLVKD